jgi:hypothetical protein
VKDSRVTYRRRHSYNTQSNKVHVVKTPGAWAGRGNGRQGPGVRRVRHRCPAAHTHTSALPLRFARRQHPSSLLAHGNALLLCAVGAPALGDKQGVLSAPSPLPRPRPLGPHTCTAHYPAPARCGRPRDPGVPVGVGCSFPPIRWQAGSAVHWQDCPGSPVRRLPQHHPGCTLLCRVSAALPPRPTDGWMHTPHARTHLHMD